MIEKGFRHSRLEDTDCKRIEDMCRTARGDILTMTSLAGCGHPGGSMSSIEMYITLFACASTYPDNPRHPDRDRIVVSHGHTSPGAYAALAQTGFIDREQLMTGFRYAGSIFEGHVERSVPGIEWGTGNLGQGLSAGCGFALAARLLKNSFHTFVLMGDGEQQKGQISEARRFAVKYGLSDLTVLIDRNRLQISGSTDDVMPQKIVDNFQSDGWRVLQIDGHDIIQLYSALHEAVSFTESPTAIVADTVMGKGVSFMENVARYHGVALTDDEYAQAIEELGLENDIDRYRKLREAQPPVLRFDGGIESSMPPALRTGTPVIYDSSKKTDNRSAFGNALRDIAETNSSSPIYPIAVFDCDLAGSVKTSGFQSVKPDCFFEVGIQEHNAATMAGALSIEGIITFFADFGVFGVCETYNQHRLNDINSANVKLVCTHIGLDVGEDGKTHQCIDYIGLLRNLFGFKVIIPADPNQTDRAIRYAAATHGNCFVGMGRSKLPVICTESGEPFFGEKYTFTYGAIDTIRTGSDAAIMTCGGMLHRALQAHDILRKKNINVMVLNVSCPKKIDLAALSAAASTGTILTYEDHSVHTGLGSIIADSLFEHELSARLVKLGVRKYGTSGTPDALFAAAGLDAQSLAETAAGILKKQ